MAKRTIFNNKSRRGEFLFYSALVALPLIQFILMYVVVNARSLLFVFQEYNPVSTQYVFSGAAFVKNLALVKDMFTQPLLVTSLINSLSFYGLSLLAFPISITISFFIYKKLPLAGFFRIVLYLPSVFVGMTMILGYKYFIERALPAIFPNWAAAVEMGGLIANPATTFPALVFYSIWISLGGSLVLYTGVMSRVNIEILEAAKVDGANIFQEFIHIVWPAVYPALTIGLYTGVVGIFSGSPGTYAFFSHEAPATASTFGYYFFTLVVGNSSSPANFPRAAMGGVIFTMIAAPLVFFLKRFFERNDPNEENPAKMRRAERKLKGRAAR